MVMALVVGAVLQRTGSYRIPFLIAGLSLPLAVTLLHAVKEIRPDVHIKAFTCVEIAEIWRQANKPLDEVFAELKAAGLDVVRVREWMRAFAVSEAVLARDARLFRAYRTSLISP